MLLKEHLGIRQLFSNKMFPILHQPASFCLGAVVLLGGQQRALPSKAD